MTHDSQTPLHRSGDEVAEKNKRLTLKLVLGVVLMFGFGFALVPLYDVFCDVTGLNGKTNDAPAVLTEQGIDESRTIKVQFVSHMNDSMPWEFRPQVRSVSVHPGETAKVSFFAKNTTAQEMVAQAIPSVSPGLSAQYFVKTECFCFTQQTLAAGESREMPLIFMVDPQIPEEYKTLTLSYTIFDAEGLQPRTSGPVGRIQ